MTRALLIVLDSVGIGGAPDAEAYGDSGADTVGHIAEACAAGQGDRSGLRSGPLVLPNLAAFGLGLACDRATGRVPPGLAPPGPLLGRWGVGTETSRGKDTPSGHWEIAGVPVAFDWGYFPDADPAFPPALAEALIREGELPGILGNRHASGTAILDELGAEHVRTGRPICYTSVDSVFQIAAHEEAFGLARLYDLCALARRLCDPYRIGRVIARPFLGDAATGFRRTPRRKDFATPPPSDTILDRLTAAGRAVVSVGKIGDIFAHRGTGTELKPAPLLPSPGGGGSAAKPTGWGGDADGGRGVASSGAVAHPTPSAGLRPPADPPPAGEGTGVAPHVGLGSGSALPSPAGGGSAAKPTGWGGDADGGRGGTSSGSVAHPTPSAGLRPPADPPPPGEGVAPGNEACLAAALVALRDLPDGGLVFVNLVDFDSEYGHRRDVAGYAAALEAFDRRVPAIRAALRPGDLCVVTADHGNDPTFRGTDHTRESVPILCFGPDVEPGTIGRRESLADIGATVLAHLGLPALPAGEPF